jgi:hypothetical protein
MLLPIGKVTSTTPGTPIALSTAVPALLNVVLSIAEFVALGTNSGKVYFGVSGFNKTTGVGCYVGTGLVANQTLGLQDLSASVNRGTAATNPTGLGTSASMNANNIYFDVDDSGEGFGGYVTY